MHTTYSRYNGRVLGSSILLLFSLGLYLADVQVLDVAASEYDKLVGLCPGRNGLRNLSTFCTKRPDYKERKTRGNDARRALLHTMQRKTWHRPLARVTVASLVSTA